MKLRSITIAFATLVLFGASPGLAQENAGDDEFKSAANSMAGEFLQAMAKLREASNETLMKARWADAARWEDAARISSAGGDATTAGAYSAAARTLTSHGDDAADATRVLGGYRAVTADLLKGIGWLNDALAAVEDLKKGNIGWAAYQGVMTGVSEYLSSQGFVNAATAAGYTSAGALAAPLMASVGLAVASYRSLEEERAGTREVQFLYHLETDPRYNLRKPGTRYKRGDSKIAHDEAAIHALWAELISSPTGTVGSYFTDTEPGWTKMTFEQITPRLRKVLLDANAAYLERENDDWERIDKAIADQRSHITQMQTEFQAAVNRLRDAGSVSAGSSAPSGGNTPQSGTAPAAEMSRSTKDALARITQAIGMLQAQSMHIEMVTYELDQFQKDIKPERLASVAGTGAYLIAQLNEAANTAQSAGSLDSIAKPTAEALAAEIRGMSAILGAAVAKAEALRTRLADRPGAAAPPSGSSSGTAPAPAPAATEKPLPNCKDVPTGTRCEDDTPTTGPAAPSTCPEGQVSIITIDPVTGKGRQTGCRVADKPLPAPGAERPPAGSSGGQSAEEKKQAEEDAAWEARVAEMDAAAAQEKKRKDDAWKQQQDDWKQFGYQPPDVKIVGPIEQESSWGLVLALNKALRESLSSMYSGLAGRKASIDRMAAEYEKIGSSLAKRLESTGAGSCFDAVQATQALPTKDIAAGNIALPAVDPDEINRRLASLEKLHDQIAGIRIVPAEELQKKVQALTVAIRAYNQELQKPEVRKWLKVINDNREILVSMSQAQIDSGIRPTGLDLAEMPDFGGTACSQAMRQMENINAQIQALRNALQARQQLLALAKPILDRMRQIEVQMNEMRAGKLGVREIAAIRAEFATEKGKSSTSTAPGKAFALYERSRSATVTSDVATMIVQALELSDRLNQQVTEVTREAGKKAVVVELEKLVKQIGNQPPTRAMLDNAAELARLGQVGGEPEVQALMRQLSANYLPSSAEKATAIGPSGTPPRSGTVPGSTPPPAGGISSRPPAATSGATAPSSSTASARATSESGSLPSVAARPLASERTTSRSDSIGDTSEADNRATATPPGQEIAQIRELYQKFVQAYQSKNLNSVLRSMSASWQASDGSGLADLEDTLRNSFRVFDVIQFRIEGLQVQKAGADTYNVSYAATLSGRINRLNVKHEETSTVQDVVKLTLDGPRILKTNGSVTIKAK